MIGGPDGGGPTVTLTTALLIVGALVLLAVVVQGIVWKRRAAPKRALPPAGAAPDTVSGEGRVEPALGDPAAAAPAAGAAEPALDASALGVPPPAERRAAAGRRGARLDALIDAIAPLRLEAPVTGEAVLAHGPPTRRAGTKPFAIEGLDTETGDWEAPQPGRRYGELQAGVQMASRSGAINEIEYSEFVQKVQAFAESIGAMADFPDMLDVVARARELDGLAGPLDAQLTVTLRSNGVAWSVGYLQQVAGRHGFVPGVLPGRLVLPSPEDGEPPLLVLAFDPQAALAEDPQAAPIREAALVLDVPQTPERVEPFPAWHRAATAMADELDATPVDDQGQPITLQAFAAIGRELGTLYKQLESLDLAAGSPAARRLFS